jgi:hypothetical protein
MEFGPLHRSGEVRTALDNVRPSRARAGVARTLSTAELEQWLERIARNRGEADLSRIRDEARQIASVLSAEAEQAQLDELIAALLGTGDTRLVTRRPRRSSSGGVIPEERPEDAHDILGTFGVVTDVELRTRVPADADDFADLLRLLNRRILEDRPGKAPGEWKQRPNRAGGTSFVAPDLVPGTLREAWRFYETLPAGLPRALFAMFAVSEVHPFADGNGRVSRALLNAELSAAGQCRIVIPLCSRADYLGALRAMSRQGNPEPLLRMADRAQRWAFLVDWSSMPRAREQLEASNALVAPDEAEDRGLILLDPS